MNNSNIKSMDRVYELDNCPECHSNNVINNSLQGESVCGDCGLVLRDHIIDNSSQGKRSFSDDDSDKNQNGTPITPLLPDISLLTVIDQRGNLSNQMKRIIKWDTRMSWSNRNMLIAVTEIKRIGTLLNLPRRVKELAANVYRKAYKENLLRGRSIKGMVVACLYYACRKERVPRTLTEVLKHTDIDPRNVRRNYRILIRRLKLNVPNIDPQILIPKYISELGLGNEVEKIVTKLIQAYQYYYRTSGKDPKGILAASIYYAVKTKNINISQHDIADKIQITEVTLRSRYKEIIRLVKRIKGMRENKGTEN